MSAPSTPPSALLVRPETIPDLLKSLDRWVVWRYERRTDKGGTKKWTKPPYRARTGEKASVTDPSTWCTFDAAVAAYERGDWDGIGLVVCDDDDIIGVDFDHCIVDGRLDPEVRSDLEHLASYSETSPSGEGVRVIARATLPRGGRKRGNFEVYESGRFLTLTGNHLGELPMTVEHRQAQVEAFHARRFHSSRQQCTESVRSNGARSTPTVASPRSSSEEGNLRKSPKLTDEEVLAAARRAANAAKFQAVYEGDDTFYEGDTSVGDLALCSMLAFYTQDEAQIDRLFRGCPRMRDKWDEVHYGNGETYGGHTIQVALNGTEATYRATHGVPPPMADAERALVLPRPGAWMDLARTFREHRSQPLLFDGTTLYSWNGLFWEEVMNAALRTELWRWLDGARYDDRGDLKTWGPNSRNVNNLVDALRAVTHADGVTAPCWLGGDNHPEPREVLPMTNGLLVVPERRLLSPTPEFFNLNAIPYAYDPDAPPPENWLDFLHTIFEHDRPAIEALQEIFGYLLLPVTGLHIIIGLFGPPRSGKGVILRTLEKLLGPTNMVATTVTQLGAHFGKQSLIGKSIATLSDVRVTRNTDMNAALETLLTISGEDLVNVPRKNKEDWVGHLDARFVIVSNEVPYFPDASGALVDRFVPLETRTSFSGREDRGLEGRIATEIRGILNWALDGYDRLHNEGELLLPKSSLALLETMERASSPVSEFVEELCRLGSELEVEKQSLYSAWETWAKERGIPHGSAGSFTSQLRGAFPGRIGESRPRRGDGRRRRCYNGIGLRDPGMTLH